MTTVAKLSADLTANSSGFEAGLRRANSAMNQSRAQWNSALSQSSRSFAGFESQVRKNISAIGDLKAQVGGFATAAASALSVQKIIQYSDAYRQIEGRLRLATESAEQFQDVQQKLFDVSQRTGTALSANVEAYARMSQSLSTAEKQQYDLVGITDTLAKTLIISGTSGEAAGELIRQFGQAASSDFKAVGQEIGSIQDQAPRLAKLLKDAFAGSGKSLKQMAEDGELSTARVLDAIVKMSGQIDQEAASLGDTVDKAFTRLDNAFLNFIGQSKLINQGTNSIAAGINLLADNFSAIGYAAGAAAAIFAGRLLTSLTASAVAWATNTREIIAYQLALARMAGISGTAAVGITAMSGATTALSRALALVGGPVGAALLVALAAFAFSSDKAAEAQDRYNQGVAEFSEKAADYRTASKETRIQIEKDVEARIKAYETELQSLQILVDSVADLDTGSYTDALLVSVGEVLGKIGVGKAPSDAMKQVDLLQKAIEKMRKLREDLGKPVTGGGGGDDDFTKNQKKTINDIMNGLKLESEQLRIQVGMYGQKEAAIARATKELQINNQLTQVGITLTAEQRKQVTEYLDAIQMQSDKYHDLEEQQKRLEEREQQRKQAMAEFAGSFQSAFEDAIVSGEKLSDVLTGLLQDILRLSIRANFIEPLVAGATGKGGFLSGLGDRLFGRGIPSHATGIDYVPQDMMARIHKGEMIIPASKAEGMRRSSGVSDGVTFHHTYNFAPGVSRAELAQIIPQIEQSTRASVLDAIGRGGKFAQAVGRRT